MYMYKSAEFSSVVYSIFRTLRCIEYMSFFNSEGCKLQQPVLNFRECVQHSLSQWTPKYGIIRISGLFPSFSMCVSY